MRTATLRHRKRAGSVTVVARYDVAVDAKKRISLRNARTKYFHVSALSNGGYLPERRVLVPPQAIPARTRKMLEESATKDSIKEEEANQRRERAGQPTSFRTEFLK